MKNVSSLKSNATNSPKTPGGISKSLLTPCRRLGLSRNWRNKGPSPFISPLAGSTQEVKEEKIEPRKRKQRVLEDNVESTPETPTVDENELVSQSNDIDKTPSRNVEIPRRKKSKTLLAAINKSQEDVAPLLADNKHSKIKINEHTSETIDTHNTENKKVVATPERTKSKQSKKQSPRVKSDYKTAKITSVPNPDLCDDKSTNTSEENSKESPDAIYEIKEKSPNDLRKECIVVIQRKIFKRTEDSEKDDKDTKSKKDEEEKPSMQALEYDSDETPLIQLSDKESSKSKMDTIPEEEQIATKKEDRNHLNEDDDFIDKSPKVQVSIVKDTKSSKNKLKTNKIIKSKVEKPKLQQKLSTQCSFDDDDDFDNNKKTILIRKTYEKVSKPLKAKSTGSITQKDIDELKARIEAKKKLLLAQSINPDTEELRNLIKKWQKGCQDALIELLNLMKTKFHDKENMGYSEMLKSLKIPPSLVGYDAENDSFNEPNDANIILGQFEDII